jgi:hypothetical protein
MRWAWLVARVETMKNVQKNFVRIPEEKRAFERTRCRWEDNIKMNFKEMG